MPDDGLDWLAVLLTDDTPTVARLAYEAYRDTLALSMPLPWERLPAKMRLAWGVVVRVVRCHHA